MSDKVVYQGRRRRDLRTEGLSGRPVLHRLALGISMAGCPPIRSLTGVSQRICTGDFPAIPPQPNGPSWARVTKSSTQGGYRMRVTPESLLSDSTLDSGKCTRHQEARSNASRVRGRSCDRQLSLITGSMQRSILRCSITRRVTAVRQLGTQRVERNALRGLLRTPEAQSVVIRVIFSSTSLVYSDGHKQSTCKGSGVYSPRLKAAAEDFIVCFFISFRGSRSLRTDLMTAQRPSPLSNEGA